MRPIRCALVMVLLLAAVATSAGAATPAPCSLPWGLRPAAPARALRLDTVLANFEDAAGNGGTTVGSLLLGSMKVSPRAALLGRVGVLYHSPPAGESEVAFTNVTIGGVYALSMKNPDWRGALYLLAALPVGSGGGNQPDADQLATVKAGVPVRSAMDNAMFAVNDLVIFPGIDLAWVRDRWTVQGEATLLQLTRMRGDEVQADKSRTNFTTGLHVGRFVSRALSLGAELRYQRWLSTPKAVDAAPKTRDTATLAFGPRLHLKAGENRWFRPGLSFGLPIDDPMSAANYQLVQLDLPVNF